MQKTVTFTFPDKRVRKIPVFYSSMTDLNNELHQLRDQLNEMEANGYVKTFGNYEDDTDGFTATDEYNAVYDRYISVKKHIYLLNRKQIKQDSAAVRKLNQIGEQAAKLFLKTQFNQ